MFTGFSESTRDAHSIPAVYQAIGLISSSVASLPLRVKANGKIINNQLARVLDEPNSEQSSYDFLETIARSLLSNGNAYIEIVRDGTGAVTQLWAHHFTMVSQEVAGGIVRYRVTNQFGKQWVLLAHEMCHIKYRSKNRLFGRSPIAVCFEALDLAVEQQAYGLEFFRNDATPSGYLHTADVVPDENYERIKSSWDNQFKGRGNRRRTAFLESGLEFKTISSSNNDAQWLESQRFSVEQIARIFNVSPIFLNDLTNSTYNNHSESMRGFLSMTLRPWLTMIEKALTQSLMLTNQKLEFETTGMLRLNQAERYDSYKTAIEAGFLTINEIRDIEGLSPLAANDAQLGSEPNADVA
ncbi:phage portal protein [Pseudomonadota bacterium]